MIFPCMCSMSRGVTRSKLPLAEVCARLKCTNENPVRNDDDSHISAAELERRRIVVAALMALQCANSPGPGPFPPPKKWCARIEGVKPASDKTLPCFPLSAISLTSPMMLRT
jgi:hypothetical protein